VLYVVDSVIRQWVEKAKKAGQAVSSKAAAGTYASGVQMVRDALPVVLSDLVKSAPENHKEKISKLLDIWERGQTFPPDMIASMKQLVNGKPNSKFASEGQLPVILTLHVADAPTAQNGTPRSNGTQQAYHQTNQQPVAPTPAPVPAAQQQQDQSNLYAAFAGLGQQNAQTNGAPLAPPSLSFPQNMVPPPPPGFVPPPPPGPTGQSALPPPPAGANDMTGQILQAMSAGLIAPDQAIQVLNAMAAAQNGGAAMPAMQPTVAPPVAQLAFQPEPQNLGAQNGTQPERYDPNESRFRDRSRSPDYQRQQSPPRRSPPSVNRRESPTYGVYDPNAGPEGNQNRGDRGRGRGKQRGGRNDRNEYRQRSPPRRQSSPPRNSYGNSKYIEWDNTLPRDHIRVLSRTLFVGGAGGTEGEIRSIFSRFGQVQTCIVNLEKRHAFVKMLTRPDAVHAKEGMDNLQDPVAQSKARQVCIATGFEGQFTDIHRLDGVWVLVPETAATTKAASASFPSHGLRMLIASGL
jgi:protein NRD1